MLRDKTIIVKVSEIELANIRQEAEKAGLTVSAFIRLLVTQWSDGIKFERRQNERT